MDRAVSPASHARMNSRVLVFLPLGPRAVPRFVADTVESFLFFSAPETLLILADDTHGQFPRHALPDSSRIFWRTLPASSSRSHTTRGEFWVRQARLIRDIIREFDFDLLLRIDEDSLFIKPGFERMAMTKASSHPRTGILGQFRQMPDGTPVSDQWVEQQYQFEINLSGAIRRNWSTAPIAALRFAFALRAIGRKAKQRGKWQSGSHITGGGCFVSRACLRAMLAAGLLPHPLLHNSNLCDDHLLSLSAQAVGFALVEAGGPAGFIAYRLNELPAGYENLRQSGFKIVHSVRRHGNDDEDKVRANLRLLTRTKQP